MTETFARYLAKTLVAQGYRPGVPTVAAGLAADADLALTRTEGMTLELAVIVDREARPGAQFMPSPETVRAALTRCLAFCGKVRGTQMPASLDVYEVGAAPPDPDQQARLIALHTGKRTIPVTGWVLDTAGQAAWCSRPRAKFLFARRMTRLLRQPRAADAALAPPPPLPDAPPRATYVLLAVLAAVFAGEVALAGASASALMSVPSRLLFVLGGTIGQLLFTGEQPWRSVTAAFLHVGLVHIAFNAVALWLVGRLLEATVGWAWFLAVFFVGASAGSAFSAWLDPNILSVGASGAILALAGAALIVSARLPYAPRQQSRMLLAQVMVPSLLPVLFIGRGSHVDYGAHIGGAIAGVVLGGLIVALWPRGASRPAGREWALLASALGAATALWGGDVVVHRLQSLRLL